MMAAVAARTKQLKVGSFVLLAPFQHPLRLAEDAALIDVLSNGRLRLGIGVGYRQEEFDVFEIPRKERLGRTLEAIEIMLQAVVLLYVIPIQEFTAKPFPQHREAICVGLPFRVVWL